VSGEDAVVAGHVQARRRDQCGEARVLEGEGRFLLEDQEIPIEAGMLLTAPAGVPHGIRNTGAGRLLVLAVLAPGP
jgi:mannose-6-phosphate isomerase-like protein (cupin superfamily)